MVSQLAVDDITWRASHILWCHSECPLPPPRGETLMIATHHHGFTAGCRWRLVPHAQKHILWRHSLLVYDVISVQRKHTDINTLSSVGDYNIIDNKYRPDRWVMILINTRASLPGQFHISQSFQFLHDWIWYISFIMFILIRSSWNLRVLKSVFG